MHSEPHQHLSSFNNAYEMIQGIKPGYNGQFIKQNNWLYSDRDKAREFSLLWASNFLLTTALLEYVCTAIVYVIT